MIKNSSLDNSSTFQELNSQLTGITEVIVLIYWVISGVFSILAIVGNSLIILAVFKFDDLRTTTNLLIASLAVFDCASGCIAYPILVGVFSVSYKDETPSAAWYTACKVGEFFKVTVSFGNLLSILLIGIDRWMCLEFPIRYRVMMSKWPNITFWRLWITFPMFVVLIVLHVFKASSDTPVPCYRQFLYPDWIIRYAPICILSSFAATIIPYIRITHIALSNVHRRAVTLHAKQSHRSISTVQIKALRMICTVFWVYVLIYIPDLILTFVIEPYVGWYSIVLEHILRLIWKINSWINPFLYAWSSKSFYEAFMHLLKIRWNKLSSNPPTLVNVSIVSSQEL